MSHPTATQAAPMSPGGEFFLHRPAPPAPTGNVVMNEATRLMCAGAYLDPSYARQVIEELVEDEARAVVPSSGFDLSPVLRHCFQANRMDLRRNLLLTLVLVVGAYFTPYAVLIWLGLGIVLTVAAASRKRPQWWVVVAALAGVVVLCFIGSRYITELLPSSLLYGEFSPYNSPVTRGSSDVDVPLLILMMVVAALVIDAYFRHRTYRILTTSLSSGAQHRLPPLPIGRVGRRVTAVSAAQWGNLTLHADRSPFLGSGPVIQSWSMCLELKSRSQSGTRLTLDPIDMHATVRRALEAMRQNPLPENEKVSGLVVTDHVVARGLRRHDNGLVDPRNNMPYAQVSPEGMAAIIRHPQGSLRYYQRVTVGAEGKQIETRDRRIVAAAQDQEVTVSAFLYLAVEGGLLYAEFVAAVMPPVKAEFRKFDLISPDDILGRAIKDVLPTFIFDVALAPFRLLRGVLAGGVARRMEKAERLCREAHVYDYGARKSIRWVAAGDSQGDYLQRLDAQRYYKLVERTTTASMLEYLRGHDVDTAEYEERVTEIHNHGVIVHGSISGPVAAGANASAVAH